jgi:medium-chain acyl-[acyl-carrier-protein] hydrolase
VTNLSNTDPWISLPGAQLDARLRILCFPYAGGGIAAFVPWRDSLPPGVDLGCVLLPGRENRLRHPPFRRMEPLVQRLAEVTQSYLDRPFAFWGHSLGAVVAFELARELRRRGRPLPHHLFVAARLPPQAPRPEPRLYDMPDAEFLPALQRRYQGVPDMILQDPEISRLFIPALRADLEVIETYQFTEEPPLDCSLSAYVGRDDASTRGGVSGWREHITGSYAERQFPGGHFFTQTARSAVLAAFVEDLQVVLERRA